MTDRGVSIILRSACMTAGVTNQDLWIDYYALGGVDSPETVDAYLTGAAVPGPCEYDLLAQALNDRLIDQELDHPVPYAEDLDLFPGPPPPRATTSA